MKIENPPVSLLILIAILILLGAILRTILLKLRSPQGNKEHKPKTPRPLKPKTEDDCPFCQALRFLPSKSQKFVCLFGPGEKSETGEDARRRYTRRGMHVTIRSAIIIASRMSAFTPWWGMGATGSTK
jgi:hypothetical protein